MNFAVFASGNGSNLQAIIDALGQGAIKGSLGLVLSDKADAYALTRARQAGVEHVVFLDPRDFASRTAFDAAVVEILKERQIELVVLAGFMRILSPVLVRAYAGRIINIHPALLPAFKGAHAVRDALAAGVATTGVTVHFVDEEVDHGPVIAQVSVPVLEGDTLASLAARIHAAEHVLYPDVINRVLQGTLDVPAQDACA